MNKKHKNEKRREILELKDKFLKGINEEIEQIFKEKIERIDRIEDSDFIFPELKISFDFYKIKIKDKINKSIEIKEIKILKKDKILQKELNHYRGYNWKKTLEICEYYLKFYENDLFFLSYKCESLLQLNEKEMFEIEFQKMIKMEPITREDYFGLGKLYGLVKDYDKALPFILKSVELEFKPSYVYLGWMYENGFGVEIDLNKTLKYNLLASDDSSVAQYNVGLIYYFEKGIERDKEKALEFWLKSSKGGYKRSFHYLGVYYFEDKNYKESFNYFLKSAQLGETLSYVYLGEFYKYGHGIDINENEAFFWFKKSFEANDLTGTLNLGNFYSLFNFSFMLLSW